MAMMERQAPPSRWLETGRLEVEMCLAMCIGGIPLNVRFFVGTAQLGHPDLIDRFPEFSIQVVGILLAAPMAAWMRFRGHDRGSNLEMSSIPDHTELQQ